MCNRMRRWKKEESVGEDGEEEGGIGENKASVITCRFRTSDRLKQQLLKPVITSVKKSKSLKS